MTPKAIKSEALLLIAAAIWGFSFVAQRAGMEHVGPFTFNGIRFALGSISLLPLMLAGNRRSSPAKAGRRESLSFGSYILFGCGAAGLVLFAGASLQQVGIVSTTAGKAGFITGLYVVIVPVLGLFFRLRPAPRTWLGAFTAAAGLYFLSIDENLSISRGDLLVLLSAFFWAGHVLIIGWLSSRMDTMVLAFLQFATCSVLSLLVAVGMEEITFQAIRSAAVPIVYGGVCSVGIAFTLQVVAQRHAPPTHAAIILSMETVFAAFGGWLILGETIPLRGLAGCALMLSGIVLSQLSLGSDYHAGTTPKKAIQPGT